MRTTGGNVYTWGDATFGALGRQFQLGPPSPVPTYGEDGYRRGGAAFVRPGGFVAKKGLANPAMAFREEKFLMTTHSSVPALMDGLNGFLVGPAISIGVGPGYTVVVTDAYELDYEQAEEEIEAERDAAARVIQRLCREAGARWRLRALIAALVSKEYDPETGQYFYVNKRTGESSWDKPVLMGDQDVDDEGIVPLESAEAQITTEAAHKLAPDVLRMCSPVRARGLPTVNRVMPNQPKGGIADLVVEQAEVQLEDEVVHVRHRRQWCHDIMLDSILLTQSIAFYR